MLAVIASDGATERPIDAGTFEPPLADSDGATWSVNVVWTKGHHPVTLIIYTPSRGRCAEWQAPQRPLTEFSSNLGLPEHDPCGTVSARRRAIGGTATNIVFQPTRADRDRDG